MMELRQNLVIWLKTCKRQYFEYLCKSRWQYWTVSINKALTIGTFVDTRVANMGDAVCKYPDGVLTTGTGVGKITLHLKPMLQV